MKCLLVDDEPGIREGLAALLRRKGHEVRTAHDCADAGRALAVSSFDVVVTDWRLCDGTAAQFLADCPWPVVAISGHPEQVAGHPAVRLVLQKPVSPSRLLEVLASLPGSSRPGALPDRSGVPLDVQRVIDGLRARLPPHTAIELLDDGAVLLLQADLRSESAAIGLDALGGDLQVLPYDGGWRLRLRLCRDGRPDLCVPVTSPEGHWPEVPELAVDFHGTSLSPVQLAACLVRKREFTAAGRRVHFLNVPETLSSCATDQGMAHDMPMREKVGPRLPAVFADLWSQT
ncbi:MAG TPA: response regulator [Planctomycetota bacterium]|nr:response regulator [Planctomycetota bacterium]